jgi:hypothetical protein
VVMVVGSLNRIPRASHKPSISRDVSDGSRQDLGLLLIIALSSTSRRNGRVIYSSALAHGEVLGVRSRLITRFAILGVSRTFSNQRKSGFFFFSMYLS